MSKYSHRYVLENSFHAASILNSTSVSKSREVCLLFDSGKGEASQQTQLLCSSFFLYICDPLILLWPK